MKYPCVELYFEAETEGAHIRIWLATDNELVDYGPKVEYFHKLHNLQLLIKYHNRLGNDKMMEVLGKHPDISAFQLMPKYISNNIGIVVYREWP